MNKLTTGLLTVLTATVTLGISMNAFGFLGLGGTKWKEEVLLHDGSKIIVERSQTRGGRHEIGQEVPLAQHTISFKRSGTRETVTWKSEYGVEIESSSLQLLAVDIVGSVPYIVTTPTGCIAYNKWKRPNPPYVFFKYDGKTWQRIDLSEFPAAIKEANVVIATQLHEKHLTGYSGVVPADEIRRINADAKNPDVQYLRVLVREPIKVAQTVECEELIYYKGAWIMPNDSIARGVLDRKHKSKSE